MSLLKINRPRELELVMFIKYWIVFVNSIVTKLWNVQCCFQT